MTIACEAVTSACPVTAETTPKKSVEIAQWARQTGYKNSSVWCKNMDELIGAITHGYPNAISQQEALAVVTLLMDQGIAQAISGADGRSLGWTIRYRREEK